MLKIVAFLAVAGFAASQVSDSTNGQGPYIWDILPPPLTASEVQELLEVAEPGVDFPIYNEIPDTGFDCKNVNNGQPGYYADMEAGCQVIRRCTIDGGMSSFICGNYTTFSQPLLTCVMFWDNDCSTAADYYSFANERLYQEGVPLHDTPPEGYIPEYLRQAVERINDQSRNKRSVNAHSIDRFHN